MSYCVNCGVELAPSEPLCPLCGVEVINPNNPWREPARKPYSSRVDSIVRHVDRQFFSSIAMLLLVIPALICLVNDILISGEITWSAYVIGSLLLVCVIFLLPYVLKKGKPIVFLCFDLLSILLFLKLVEGTIPGAHWFLNIALPITMAFGFLTALLIVWLTTKKPRPLLITIGIIVYFSGVLTVCIEIILRRFYGLSFVPDWSFYTFIPCLVIGTLFVLLNKRKTLRDAIYKRMFF